MYSSPCLLYTSCHPSWQQMRSSTWQANSAQCLQQVSQQLSGDLSQRASIYFFQECPFPWRIWIPLMQGILGPHESVPHSNGILISLSVLQSSSVCPTHRHTDLTSVAVCCIYALLILLLLLLPFYCPLSGTT